MRSPGAPLVAAAVLLVLSFTWMGAARADELTRLFEEANSSYESGDYGAARSLYEQIVAAGYESGALWYNLGSAYYKLRDKGRAVLALERARRLLQRDEDVRFNLALANLLAKDRISSPPEWLLSRWRRALRERVAGDEVVRALLLIYTLGVFMIIASLFVRRARWRRMVVWAVAATGVAFAVVGLFAIEVVTYEVTRHEAVLLADEVAVKSAPQDVGTDLFLLHAGTKVELRSRQGDWVQIRLVDGKVGWTPVEALEEI